MSVQQTMVDVSRFVKILLELTTVLVTKVVANLLVTDIQV